MKVTTDRDSEEFKPVTIMVTLESPQDIKDLHDLGKLNVSIPELFYDKEQSKRIKLFLDNMRDKLVKLF